MNHDHDNWMQIGQDLVGKATWDMAGWSVSLSGDGETVAFGAPASDGDDGLDEGQVKVYHLADSSDDSLSLRWTQVGLDIYGDQPGDRAGWSVSLSSDGKTIAIGSHDSENYSGYVRVFGV